MSQFLRTGRKMQYNHQVYDYKWNRYIIEGAGVLLRRKTRNILILIESCAKISNMKKRPSLSKSRFIAGLQCPLRLWYKCYDRNLAAPITPAQQAIFDSGHEVGRLATRCYPGGILIEEDYLHAADAVKTTAAAVKKPGVPSIYEAAFSHDDVLIRADILERPTGESWNLVEVKSSSSVKDVYYWDVAIQYYVLQGVGLKINRAGILHLNNQYVYDGNGPDLESLFYFSDMTDQVAARQREISLKLKEMKEMLAGGTAPEIVPSRHCKKPVPCEFWDHCTEKLPEFWVYGLSGIREDRLLELMESGIFDIRDVPGSFPLTDLQQRIKTCVINRQEYISPFLSGELNDVTFPVHFLDFETVSSAVPRYSGTRPYQAVPFQWSDHILQSDGRLDHHEYLCNSDKDPREEFTETLISSLNLGGSIFIYANYEKRIVKELSEFLPRFESKLQAVSDRFKDLQAIIKQHYYHLKFYGSFSIKNVLPALLPEMDYKSLKIQEGSQASFEYLRMIDPATPQDKKEQIKNDLLTYCGLDTLAMVRVREALLR